MLAFGDNLRAGGSIYNCVLSSSHIIILCFVESSAVYDLHKNSLRALKAIFMLVRKRLRVETHLSQVQLYQSRAQDNCDHAINVETTPIQIPVNRFSSMWFSSGLSLS